MPYFHIPLAKLLTTLNQNTVKFETSSSFTFLERETIHLLHDAFYHNTTKYEEWNLRTDVCVGMVCSGGTIANLTALWVARNNILSLMNGFKGIAQEGLLKGMQAHT